MIKNWMEEIELKDRTCIKIYRLEPTLAVDNIVQKYKVSFVAVGPGFRRRITRYAHLVDKDLYIYSFTYNKQSVAFRRI